MHCAPDIKKNEIKPWLNEYYCLPGKADAAYVAAMEDVLEVYKRPFKQECPVVCMDEMPKQLIGEIRPPLPIKPGKPKRYDYEYKRNGTASIFMFFSPLHGWRRVSVCDRRTRQDWAQEVQTLVDVDFPEAEKIILVMDNLNTHDTASLYATFPAAEARRLASKLEIHHTPKHGSWLNMAELEFSVLSRQALAERMENKERLCQQTDEWMRKRNQAVVTMNWQFTTEDARIKLKKLYPSIETR